MPRKALLLALLSLAAPIAYAQSFTLEQALSAPFTIDLHAAPTGNRFVWVANLAGARNLFLAEPSSSSAPATQLTHYTGDDGQDILDPAFTPDGSAIVFVHGSNAAGGDHPVPDPAWVATGEKQQLWLIPTSGDTGPRLLGEGHSPAISPDGRTVAYCLRGQVYTASLTGDKPNPHQLLVTRGTDSEPRWSPDGTRIAFVSSRGDHGFITVYTVATQSVLYLDPSTDHDSEPIWSPDSTQIAFLRIPSELEEDLHGAHPTALPWSIRLANAATGAAREIWRAHEGPGSAYRELAAPGTQLHWIPRSLGNADTIVFPWEGDNWLHLYSVPITGGSATLLTPGNFEVEHVNQSEDRRTIVFDSNQATSDPLDIDRRHAWQLTFAPNAQPKLTQLTSGTGIETRPTISGDNHTVVVLAADAHRPVHAALVLAPTQLKDLAPQLIPVSFPGAQFVTPQQVIFPSTDNLQIHGQLFLPAHLASGRHPAIVFYHGGSQRQMVLGFHYMEYYSNAYAFNQYLCSLGYIVLSINYRSGIGYGLPFREFPGYGATGAKEFDDALAANQYLRTRADVDPARIGAWGGSWGGYLTALSLARASNLFAAGFDMEGVHNWLLEVSFPAHWDEARRKQLEDLAYASSPISSVSTWRSPVLLVHGDDDRNVPFAETVRLMEALRKQHVDAEELIFPDEIHDLLLHQSWLRAYQAGADFFQRKLPLNPAK